MVASPDRMQLSRSRSVLVRPGDEKRMPSPSSTGSTYTRISSTSPRCRHWLATSAPRISRFLLPAPSSAVATAFSMSPERIRKARHRHSPRQADGVSGSDIWWYLVVPGDKAHVTDVRHRLLGEWAAAAPARWENVTIMGYGQRIRCMTWTSGRVTSSPVPRYASGDARLPGPHQMAGPGSGWHEPAAWFRKS